MEDSQYQNIIVVCPRTYVMWSDLIGFAEFILVGEY